jgi:hypothetical protein
VRPVPLPRRTAGAGREHNPVVSVRVFQAKRLHVTPALTPGDSHASSRSFIAAGGNTGKRHQPASRPRSQVAYGPPKPSPSTRAASACSTPGSSWGLRRPAACSTNRKKRPRTLDHRFWRNSRSDGGGGTARSRRSTRRFIFIAFPPRGAGRPVSGRPAARPSPAPPGSPAAPPGR